ncbi:hypothetical protein RJ639_032798 [Escallonia herrerae]|uniref:Uncharacterized protein n=1 Tax=Escallonia herrerae TaxID=1293975 RepID=A0AA88WU91_9ASTE|nr:hypothetical protein RJ639_032798 [Escallonia herrerae]
MGTKVGHVAPGFGFFLIGLWHLINHIKLHSLHPNSYRSSPWFPTSKIRYLELFLIMGGSFLSISMEHLMGPSRHQRFDPESFGYSSITMALFIYAAFSILIDQIGPKAQYGLTLLLGAMPFIQQLLFFHFHSGTHMGIESQYHLLLELIILVCLITTLMAIGYPKSFFVSFVRSLGILFQGLWFVVMGFMIWTPSLTPRDCFMNKEAGHHVVRCHSDEALERAKSVVNVQFSWYFMGVTVFAVSLYLLLGKIYPEKVEYASLTNSEEEHEDVEAQKESKLSESKSFIPLGETFAPFEMAR